MPKKIIFIDGETIPSGDIESFEVVVPGTYKNKEKIDEYKNDPKNKIEQFKKRSLNTSTADFVALSFAVEDNQIVNLLANPEDDITEEDMLVELEELIMKETYSQTDDGIIKFDIYWVGFKIRDYDLQILFKKAIKYKLYRLAKLIPRNRYDKRVIDIYEIWTGSNTLDPKGGNTMKDVREFLGLEGKTYGMDGSQVYNYYLEKRYTEISEYCESDVEEERELFYLMLPGLDIEI